MPGPIEHVVFLVKENHGYDNYFGRFPGADGDGTLANAANPPAVDPSHTHKAWLNRATGAVREQYSAADIPTYWAYAQRYTLCDRYFTEIAGPSTPNHLMLIAADSPWIDNPPGNYRVQSKQVVDIPSLPAQLEQAGHTWGNYGGYAFEFVKALAGKQLPSTQFATDAAAGQAADRLVGLREPRPQRARARHRRRPAERRRQRHERLGVDGTAGRRDRRGRALGQDGDLHHVGRLGRLGRSRRSAGGGDVERRHAVPLREPRPVPRPRRVCEGRLRLAPAAFARQPRPLLRDDVRTAVAERAHRRRGRHGRLLRLHARAAAAERAATPTPTPTPTPPVPTAHLLTEIADAAARASDRISAAAAASTDPSVKQQLRYAAMDVERVTSLATGKS